VKKDVVAHQDRIEECAKVAQEVAAELGIDVQRLARHAFLRARPKFHTAFVWAYWGPIKLAAGSCDAVPPMNPIPAGHRVKGVSTLLDPLGGIVNQWVKTTETRETPEDTIARIMESLPHRVKALEPIPKPRAKLDSDLLACYPLGDPHIGMLAWAAESGENFDLKIAEKLLRGGIEDLIERGPNASEALIVNLGDFFHFDNDAMNTTRGAHHLDVDGRSARVLEVGMHIFVCIVEAALRKHAIVTVDCVAGNHDQHTSIMVSIALRAHFLKNKRVVVLLDPSPRHYHRFGKVLLGTTHGDKGKIGNLPMVMAEERASDWGATKFRYWLHGHIHHVQKKELGGCVIEAFRTLAPRDSWHAGQGYTAGRDTHRIVYHKEYGEVSREVCNVDRLRGR